VSDKYNDLMSLGLISVSSKYSLVGQVEYIDEFYNCVFKPYVDMDYSLNFLEEKNEAAGSEERSVEEQGIGSVDYKGIKCPMIYVKAKLAFEEMAVGQRLEILLDDGEPIENVPRPLSADGQQIERRIKESSYWKIVVRKRV